VSSALTRPRLRSAAPKQADGGHYGIDPCGILRGLQGDDTLLIDVDAEGLRALIAWLRDVMTSDRKVLLSACSGVTLQAGLRVEVFRSRDDAGLLRTAETTFVWQRSEDGWTDIVELLAPMETGACHQYLGGPRDDVQVMASFGEYGDQWWNRYGN
jgi:hypothetical protein